MRPRPRSRERLAVVVYERDGERFAYGLDPYASDSERAAAGVETLAALARRIHPANVRRAKARWEARGEPLPEGVQVQRVWRRRPAAELRERLGGQTSVVWSDGDVLELLYRGRADRVACSGGIQLALWRCGRSDVWELSVRVAQLDEAVLTLVPIPLQRDEPRFGGTLDQEPLRFRGPQAPPEAPLIDPSVDVTLAELDGPGIGGPRQICVWRPHGSSGELPVVYCADGAADGLARTVGAAVSDGRLPPVLLVGIASGSVQGSVDRRAQEYLPGFSRRRFAAHERFVLEHVLPWAEREHGAARTAAQRFALGFSNGATWALAMAQRHPAAFGGAAAFSVAGERPRRVRHSSGQRYALCAGTLEDGFRETTGAWAEALRRSSAAHVVHRECVAGHDYALWLEQAPWAVGELLLA